MVAHPLGVGGGSGWGTRHSVLLVAAVVLAFAVAPPLLLLGLDVPTAPRELGRAVGRVILWPLAFALAAAWAFSRGRRVLGGTLLVVVASVLALFLFNLAEAVAAVDRGPAEQPVAFADEDRLPPVEVQVGGELRLCHPSLGFSLPVPDGLILPDALQERMREPLEATGMVGWAYEEPATGRRIILSTVIWSRVSEELFRGILAGVEEEARARDVETDSSFAWASGEGRISVAFEINGVAVDQVCRSDPRENGRMLVLCAQTIAAGSEELAFVRDGLEMEACPTADPGS